MSALNNKKILLGVSGGIAAYKAAVLARRLMDEGATVRVVMTDGARAFMQPLTFQALTGNPVHTDLLDPAAEAAMGHIELARWPDLILIAPASANTLARLAHGLADDLLGTLCLATDRPLYVAPAMNRLMWTHPATQENVRVLGSRGVSFIGPADGVQACGETGSGRMREPEEIRDALMAMVEQDTVRERIVVAPVHVDTTADVDQPLRGRRLLITAGPTREAIDPVRYISNHSSGKMGFALAEAARAAGAEVTLVAGPVNLQTDAGIERIDVISAAEMLEAVMRHVDRADVFIGVAAVADYRLAEIHEQKIKKSDETMQLALVRNPDILRSVAELPDRPFVVGFAAETEQVEKHARGKLQNKRLDMIAANHVARKDDPVFGADTNALDVFWPEPDGHAHIPSADKFSVAQSLLELIGKRLHAHESDA